MCRVAVDEEQTIGRKYVFHQPLHMTGMAGQQAASMVVDADGMGYRRFTAFENAAENDSPTHVERDSAGFDGPFVAHRICSGRCTSTSLPLAYADRASRIGTR